MEKHVFYAPVRIGQNIYVPYEDDDGETCYGFTSTISEADYSESDLEKFYYRNAWQNIDAIKNKKVFSVSGDIFTRPGPRVVEAVKMLKEILNEN